LPYALACLGFPALQGLLSHRLGASRQGELQGGVAALMSATSMAGSLLMTQLFAQFSGPAAILPFPGAPMGLGALLAFLALGIVLGVLGPPRRNRSPALGHPPALPTREARTGEPTF
jgi:MFS transporter, DHA1 family, tetracycline resistance protein